MKNALRYIPVLFLLLSYLVFLPLRASAHIAGQPPFFLMNGKYADFYPVYTTSLPDFSLPQDIAPETYLVNQEIIMEIDTKVLPFPPEITESIQFSWDFGDGTKGSGNKNTHVYSKIGSYLLTITADYGGYEDEYTKPVIQAVIIHIIPDRTFQLPKAIITVNDKTISDPLVDTLTFKQGTKLTFSAEKSISGNAQIKEYLWDGGDGQRRSGKTISLKYSSDQSYVFPFLRITTEDGFISDTYVQIENIQEGSSGSEKFPLLPILIGVNVLIGIFVGIFILKKN